MQIEADESGLANEKALGKPKSRRIKNAVKDPLHVN